MKILKKIKEHPAILLVLVVFGTIDTAVYLSWRSNKKVKNIMQLVIEPLCLLFVAGVKEGVRWLFSRRTQGP